MSANPEAFAYLRKVAYLFAQKHGRDRQRLRDHCIVALTEWRVGEGAGSGLTEAEANHVATAVANWTATKYRPPRKKAERSREERAAAEIGAPVLLEFAAETYGSATIRNAARISGQSKTTVARHLRQQGVSPVRQKKVEALPGRIKWLVEILDETFPRDGAGLVPIDDLAAAVWDKVTQSLPETPRSTQSTRRKKLAHYMAAVNGATLGFHLFALEDVVAVRRGRRFKGIKDTATWIEEERRLRAMRGVLLPKVTPTAVSFWEDPWVCDVLAVLQIGLWPYFTDPAGLDPLLRLTRPLLDPRPLHHLFQLVIERGQRDNFGDDLHGLADRVHDPAIRMAAHLTASHIEQLNVWAQYGHPVNYFNDADRTLAFMKQVQEVAPDSHAKLEHLRDQIFGGLAEEFGEEFDAIQMTLDRCGKLREIERQGK